MDPQVGERLHVLQDDRMIYQGQLITLVVADTLEQAVYASTLVRVAYAEEAAVTDVAGVSPALPTQRQPTLAIRDEAWRSRRSARQR